MKILSIALTQLRNEEWNSLLTDFVELVPVYGAARLGIAELFALLTPLHDKIDDLLEILDKSVYTAEMQEADKERDTLFRALFNVVKSSRKVSSAADKAVAEKLFILLSNYKRTVLKSSYAEESSALYNLLQDLQSSKYAADVTLLGFNKMVQNLDAAEQKFLNLRKERIKEDIAKPQERVREVRKQADALYKSIIDVLYARLVVDGLGGDVAINPDDLKTGPLRRRYARRTTGKCDLQLCDCMERYPEKIPDHAGRTRRTPGERKRNRTGRRRQRPERRPVTLCQFYRRNQKKQANF